MWVLHFNDKVRDNIHCWERLCLLFKNKENVDSGISCDCVVSKGNTPQILHWKMFLAD